MSTCRMLTERAEEYIRWPNQDNPEDTASGFIFPGTIGMTLLLFSISLLAPMVKFDFVGCLDGTDIHLKQPIAHLAAYTNRKSVTSVKLQGVCDSNLKFMDISCGWPGSMHDSRIFGISSLSRILEEKLRGTNYHILGDSAYQLGVRLITPLVTLARSNPRKSLVSNKVKPETIIVFKISFSLFSPPLHFAKPCQLIIVPSYSC